MADVVALHRCNLADRHRSRRELGAAALLLLICSVSSGATRYVDGSDPTCSDATGVPYCGVQAAVTGAATGDTIVVAPGVYPVGPTLELWNRDLRIVGAGTAATFLDGGEADQVFAAYNGADLELVDLTVRRGYSGVDGGCIEVGNASLHLRRTVVTGCTAVSGGGAIHGGFGSHIEIVGSTISSSDALYGGGLKLSHWNEQPSSLRMVDSLVRDNTALRGGGLFLTGALELTNVTVSWNFASDRGGGVYLSGTSTSTEASGTLAHLTVTRNWADSDADGTGIGGGVYLDGTVPAVLRGSILTDNWAGSSTTSDCWGTLQSGGYNLITTLSQCTVAGDGTGNVLALSALLGTLEDNGGPTRTHALDPASAAVDAGDPSGCLDAAGLPRRRDQRGFPSPEEGGDGFPEVACDIGAFEIGPAFFADGFESSTTSGWSAASGAAASTAGSRSQ